MSDEKVDHAQAEVKASTSRKRLLKGRIAITVVIVALLAAVGLGVWLLKPRGNAGRPVPAPRSVTIDQSTTGNTASADQTLTISPEEVQRIGIKIETVGEQMSDQATSQTTTGIVQSNAYRETPVVSIVGGIVRNVGPELGQSVKKGQTVAVVFSNELAETQAKYLTSVTELEEHHKHHARTEQLVEIGAASREELEMAASKLRAAESELANLRQRLLLFGLSSQR